MMVDDAARLPTKWLIFPTGEKSKGDFPQLKF